MSLYSSWKDIAERDLSQSEYDEFWGTYLEQETSNYQTLLENHEEVFEGKLKDLAEKFDMDAVTFTGFLDGINTSLVESLELEALDEDSEIKLEIDFEKLYWNMHDAKANWLYNLPEWEGVLSEDKRRDITKEYNKSKMAVREKVGRNTPCPCGSGKKYKKCCGK